MRSAISMAYTMSSGDSPLAGPATGSADRMAMEVSDRANTSVKYESTVKHDDFRWRGTHRTAGLGEALGEGGDGVVGVVVHVMGLYVEHELVTGKRLAGGVGVDGGVGWHLVAAAGTLAHRGAAFGGTGVEHEERGGGAGQPGEETAP